MTGVVAGVLRRRGQVLIAQRRHPASVAGQWEFPGGKIEPGETPQDALKHEWREELGVGIEVGALVCQSGIPHLAGELILLTFEVIACHGEPSALDHQALAWVALAELQNWDLLPTNRIIVRAVQGQ